MFQSGPRLATTSTTPWGAAPPGRMGSASTMTGSWSEVEITGWLTIGLSCRPRSTPSCRSCSMIGSLSCTPERAPEPRMSTTLTETKLLVPST